MHKNIDDSKKDFNKMSPLTKIEMVIINKKEGKGFNFSK